MSATESVTLLEGLLAEWTPKEGGFDNAELKESRDNIMEAWHQGRIDGEWACGVCGMRHGLELLARECCWPRLKLNESRKEAVENAIKGYTLDELESVLLLTDEQVQCLIEDREDYFRRESVDEYYNVIGVASYHDFRTEKGRNKITLRYMLRHSLAADVTWYLGDDWATTTPRRSCGRFTAPEGWRSIPDKEKFAKQVNGLMHDYDGLYRDFCASVNTNQSAVYRWRRKEAAYIKNESYDKLVELGMEAWDETHSTKR